MREEALFINPRATYVGEIAQKCYPPLNLLYLAAALRRDGIGAAVIDANALRLKDAEIESRVREHTAILVGIPLFSETMKEAATLAGIARAALPRAKIVFGGPHASALPERTLREYPEADYVLTGECEESISPLVRAARGEGEAGEVPGLFYREGESVRRSRRGEKPPDIAALPRPARDLMAPVYSAGKYYTILVRERPVDTLITSRGCPHECAFCYNTGRHYRFREAEDVLDEIVSIRERGIRTVEIVEDSFTVNRARALRLFDLLKREKLNMRFRIKSRVDAVDEELLRRAREAGVYQISYGMESGAQELLDAMGKGTTVEQNARACALTMAAGIACHTSWLIGYPGDTPELISQTARFIRAIRPTTVNIDALIPYPQTRVYAETKDNGTLVGDWTPQTRETPWVRLPWMRERADLDCELRRRLRGIYLRPYYFMQFGKMLLGDGNVMLARYAAQELRKVVRR